MESMNSFVKSHSSSIFLIKRKFLFFFYKNKTKLLSLHNFYRSKHSTRDHFLLFLAQIKAAIICLLKFYCCCCSYDWMTKVEWIKIVKDIHCNFKMCNAFITSGFYYLYERKTICTTERFFLFFGWRKTQTERTKEKRENKKKKQNTHTQRMKIARTKPFTNL